MNIGKFYPRSFGELVLPNMDIAGDTGVVAGKTFLLNLFEQHKCGEPIPFRPMGVGLYG
jgi:hypothetical protein